MNLFYLIIVFHIVILPAQSKLDSLNDLILQYEDRVTSTTLELDSLQQILLNLHAKYAEERFLLLEKSFVRRINRAAFAGMWIDEPLKGKRKEIPQGEEVLLYPYYIRDFIRVSYNDTIGYMSSAFYDQVGLPPYFEEARKQAIIREKTRLNLENENDRFKRREKEIFHESKYLAKSIEDYTYAQKKNEYRKRILLDKWGEDLGRKILDGIIEIGYTDMMVEEAIGHPESINRTEYSFFVREQWVYNKGKYQYIYLEDGVVTSIQTKG